MILAGALLDSHTLYWLVRGEPLSNDALEAIGENQAAGTLYVSPITAWELAIASRKPAHRNPVDLGPSTPSEWFAEALRITGAKLIPSIRRSPWLQRRSLWTQATRIPETAA